MAENERDPGSEGERPKAVNPYLPSVAPSTRERRSSGEPATPAASTPAASTQAASTPAASGPALPPEPAPPAPPPPPPTYGASVPGLEVQAPRREPEPRDESALDGAFTSAHTTAARPRRAQIERLSNASTPSLRTRRARIDARIFEIAHPIGEAALSLERLRATKLVDLDRVLKKLDRVEDEIFELEKETTKPEGFLGALQQNVGKLADRLASRELFEKKRRLVGELGLALLAADRRVLEKRASDVARFVQKLAAEAKQVDELFVQSRLVDDELDLRERDGRLYREPKVLEKVVEKTGEVVGDATDAATDKLKDLGKQAAKAAVKQGGKAIMGLASGALELGRARMDPDDDDGSDERRRKKKRARADADEDSDDEASDAPAPPAGKRDVTALLRDLARLHRDGILTDAEYARKKAELLERL